MTTPALDLSVYIGNRKVTQRSKAMLAVPAQQGVRHAPIPHAEFYSAVERSLAEYGIETAQTAHALLSHGEIYFGMCEVQSKSKVAVPIIGWSASHNQRISATLYFGAGVRDLNNLCFNTEVKVAGRQTINFRDRVATLVDSAIGDVETMSRQQRATFAHFLSVRLGTDEAECAIVQMVRDGIISPSKVGAVIKQWDFPDAAKLQRRRNVWRLFNAVASTYKPVGTRDAIGTLVERSPRLLAACKELVMEKL